MQAKTTASGHDRIAKNKKYAIRNAAAVQYCSLLGKYENRQVSADPRNWRRRQCIRAWLNVRSVDVFFRGTRITCRGPPGSDEIRDHVVTKGPGSLRILWDPI